MLLGFAFVFIELDPDEMLRFSSTPSSTRGKGPEFAAPLIAMSAESVASTEVKCACEYSCCCCARAPTGSRDHRAVLTWNRTHSITRNFSGDALGVQRLHVDGGKIYGWKINDRVTFGRFKGESDEFGFSFEVNKRQRVEITTDGVRWRRAIGGD